jgi:hypothetical protein
MQSATGLSSNRNFGLTFAGLFLAAGLWPTIHHAPLRIWALGLAFFLVPVSLMRPAWLRPLNLVWYRIGLLLHRIVSPLIMALLFFAVVTPVGLLMGLLGNDPLALKPARTKASTWIARETDGTDMRQQS